MNPRAAWRTDVHSDDLASIRRIIAATGVFNKEETAVAVELAEDRLMRGAASDYHFLFADMDDVLVAYSCFGRIPFTAGRFDLYWIAVDPAFQKQKLATDLLKRTEALVKEAGGAMLYAETSGRYVYEPARNFYKKHGFVEQARLPDFYSVGDDKIIFCKTLQRVFKKAGGKNPPIQIQAAKV